MRTKEFISRWTEGIIFFFFLLFESISRATTQRDHAAGRTRLINPKGCRSPGNNNETPFMHAWIPPFPPPRPPPQPPHLLPSRSIHVSFFTFTCCYSKISCPNRHLGSTLPASLSSFNSTATDGLSSLESSYPSSAISSDSPSTSSFSSSFFIGRARPSSFVPSHFFRSTPRLRGLYLASPSASSSSSSSSWLSPRGNRMLARGRAHTRPGFFQKNPAAPIFYGGPFARYSRRVPSAQLAHL